MSHPVHPDARRVSAAPVLLTSMQISESALADIVAHARSEAPRECCGLLVGTSEVIERAVAARNAAASTTRYLVDPSEHFMLIRELRGSDRIILGAYHSHPASPAVPSATDVEEAWPAPFVYLIVSLLDVTRPEVRAFTFRDGRCTSVELTTGSRP